MDKINLLYARNLITRRTAVVQQELSFVVLVDSLSYDKSIDAVSYTHLDVYKRQASSRLFLIAEMSVSLSFTLS